MARGVLAAGLVLLSAGCVTRDAGPRDAAQDPDKSDAGIDAGCAGDADDDAAQRSDAGCIPRDDDDDGYFACDCVKPRACCAPDDRSPMCAADCCDKPGDPGCPATVTTLLQAAQISPGMPDTPCDGISSNCANTIYGTFSGYACSPFEICGP